MKRLILFALSSCLVLTPSVKGDGCGTVHVQKVVAPTYATPAYVAPTYAPTVATVVVPTVTTIAVQPVFLPIYSAVYQPAPVAAPPPNHDQELLSELKSLRAQVQSLQQQQLQAPTYPPPQPLAAPAYPQQQGAPQYPQSQLRAPSHGYPQQPLTAPGPDVPPMGDTLKSPLGAKCFGCHSPQSADERGGGMRMWSPSGGLAMTEAQRMDAIARLNSGNMPKGTTMTAEEKLQAFRLLSGSR